MSIFRSRHRNRIAQPAMPVDRSHSARDKSRDQLRDPLTSVLMSAMRWPLYPYSAPSTKDGAVVVYL